MTNETEKTGKYPSTSYSTIIKGRLYLGGMTAFYYMEQDNLPYTTWFHCAKEIAPTFEKAPYTVEWVKLDDCEATPDLLELATETADKVCSLLEKGEKVLVSCIEGRNRSGLVVALALLKMGCDNPIDMLRLLRHPAVLSNKSFCEVIRKEEANEGRTQN